MKLSGMAGTGSGKLGSQVYASVAGEQIVRNYQPNVSNPNTSLQVNQRARMKLLSQLSAVFSPVIAYQRKGMVSARNQFVKRNFALSSGNDGEAQLTIENIQLTSGTAGLPGITANRNIVPWISVELQSDATKVVDRVVYVFFKKTAGNQLQLISSSVVTEAGEAGVFPARILNVVGDVVIYAYGMKDLNSKASAGYGNYSVESGEDIATLFMSRKLDFNSYRFTKTRGCQLFANEQTSHSVGPNEVRVYVTPSGSGTVQGSGIYQRGATAQLTATPEAGSVFVGWMENGTNRVITYSPTLQLRAEALVDYVAVFQNPESETGGLNGGEFVNPLPYDVAVVEIDGEVVDVTSGNVDYGETFDDILISGLDEGHELVYVPIGSVLGAEDNETFLYNTPLGDGYSMFRTETDGGAIYYDGMLFFYINTTNNLPVFSGQVEINGETATVTDGVVEVESDYVLSLSIARGEDRYVAKVSQANGTDKTMLIRNSDYFAENLAVPCTVYYNGFKVLEIKRAWSNPYPDAQVEINGEEVEVAQNIAISGDRVMSLEILDLDGSAVVTCNAGGVDVPMIKDSNGYWVLQNTSIQSFPAEVFVDGNLWFTIISEA